MRKDEGKVMVEPLAEKPFATTTDAWLSKISSGNNVNAQILQEKLSINNLPALKIRYRTDDGEEMEYVYVVSGQKTFAVEFSGDLLGDRPVVPLESFINFSTYLKMLDTFRVKP